MAIVNNITFDTFGKLKDGTEIKQFCLSNSNGVIVKIINFGGIITSIICPDKNGELSDITLGFDTIDPYLHDSPYFGALIGRFGNRIANGKFSLGNKEYQVPQNDGTNCLHGGTTGFDKVIWSAEIIEVEQKPALRLTHLSADGDQGFPGNLNVQVIYQLTENNALNVDFSATTDESTIVNLTQHTYFNLRGKSDVLSHHLTLDADEIIPVGKNLIPTGAYLSVEGTPFDFREGKKIGDEIEQDHEQLSVAGGYDHTFILNKQAETTLDLAATVIEYTSGRVLKVLTTEPGIQFYSGNFLDGSLQGKGQTYKHRSGFCLEPQHFPDSPNQPHFPSTELNPGETYQSKMRFEFSTLEQ